MSSKQMELALQLILQDKATTPAQQNIDKVVKKTNELGVASKAVKTETENFAQAVNKVGSSSQAIEKLTAATKQAANAGQTLSREYDGVSRAIERTANAGRILGTTPIPQNFREYLRQLITDSKTLQASFNAIRTTAGQMTPGNVARGVGSVNAAFQAAKAATSQPVNAVLDYSKELTYMANTAYAGKSMAEKQGGMAKLNSGIVDAIRQGGGTREAALAAADSMIARGSVGEVDDVIKLMPTVMRTATAGKADATEIGAIVSSAIKQAGVGTDQVEKVLGMALYGGMAGGFELKDMSKWMPAQFAMAKQAGISGVSGAAKIIALNEMAIDSSGSTDEAGNNVRDFLHELNASNTANHLKRFSIDAKTNQIVEKQGHGTGGDYIDLGHTLAANQAKGVDAIDSVIGIVTKIAESDPKFVQAKKQMEALNAQVKQAKENGDESAAATAAQQQQALVQSVYQILLGRGVGKLFQNQQSLLGGIGAIMNPEGYRKMVGDIQANGGAQTIDDNYKFISEQPWFKMQQKQQEESFALQRGLEGATGALGKYSEAVTDLYRKYPAFGSAVEAGTVAVNGFTAALGALGLMRLLSGGGTAAAASGVGGALAAGGGAGAAAAGASTLALAGTVGAASLALSGDTTMTDAEREAQKKRTESNLQGMDAEMAKQGYRRVKGWLFDSYEKIDGSDESKAASVPVDKAAFGRQFDQGASNLGGVSASSPLERAAATAQAAANPAASGNDNAAALAQAATALTAVAQQPLVVRSELHMDGHVIATAVNEVNGRTASRY